MAIIQTTNAWGMPIWIDQSTGEQVSDPSMSSYTAPQQGNAYGQVAGKFLSGGYADGQLQDNSAWNNPDGSVTWLSGGKPQVLSQADWDKEMARQVAADRGPLGALMELGTQFVLPAVGAYNLASGVGNLLDKAGWGAPSTATSVASSVPTTSQAFPNAGTNYFSNSSQLGSGQFLENNIGQVGQSLLDAQPATLNQMVGQATGSLNAAGLNTLPSLPGINSMYDFLKGQYAPAISDAAGNLNLASSLAAAPSTPSLTPKQLSDMAKAASGLLGSSAPTPTQSSPMGGGSSGYQANIQPDMGLLSLNKPQYANIFQTQALQPIYGSQRGY